MNVNANLPLSAARCHRQRFTSVTRSLPLILHRGLAPQNKPELQKVMEKRKREQVLKAQKEEQEAHKKRSDLEIELMKRQQKLEQVNHLKVSISIDIYEIRHLYESYCSDLLQAETRCRLSLLQCLNLNLPMSVFLQLELEQHKDEEEQENTPEFVKMKSNLRRTKQEADGEERTT